jgi:PKD repeat protein
LRRLVLTVLTLAALALPASALAATVNINNDGYDPAKLTIAPGDSVSWHYNNFVTPHGVQFGGETPDCATQLQVLGNLTPDCPPSPRPFNTPGRFTYHDPGCNPGDSGCITGQVVVYVPPTASFTSSTASQLRGQAIDFDGGGSTSPGGSITNYSWNFGDSTTATGQTISHFFTSAGTFNVTLSVTDDQDKVATQAQQVTIAVPDSDGDGVNDDLDKCVSNAGPAPDGCPIAPLIIPAPISSSAVAPKALGLPGGLKSGVNVVVNCSGACTGFLTLTRNGSAVAIPNRVTLAGSGSKLVTMRFTTAAKRSLAKLKSAKLQLQLLVADSLTRVQTRRATIAMERVKTIGKLPAIGISDNQPATFADPNFQVLKLRYARLVSPWNAIFTEPARLDAWLQNARAHGIRPLVSFEHSRGQACPGKRCKGPSVAQYKRAWKAFHKKYPWVKDISPWNEVNSATQPTGKRPDLAAAYYNVVRGSCHGCTIVAADLLDAPNIRRYSAAFLAKAKGKPRLWGLHNYTDTNRFRSRGTNALLQTVKGTVWLTETGGVVRFVTQKGVVALPKSETRAKKAMDYMFRLAEANAHRIKRIYVYQWKINNPSDRFDAGVVRPNGQPRPSYNVLSVNASIARKR